MSKNIVQKIWEAHIIKQNPGHPAILAIDLQLIHEVTSPQGFTTLREKNLPVKFPYRNVATLDHSIPTREDRENIHDPIAKKQVETLRQNTKDFGIKLFDYDSGHQGIVHVIGPELGLTQPGMTIVCGDSHTSTHGAFGALAFGVGSTEVGLVLATSCILQQDLKVMKVEFLGKFQPGVFAKDAILKLISKIGVGGANGFVIEFCGQAVRDMNIEARMTLCNMSIECGARAGLVSPDEKTFEWILGNNYKQILQDFENKSQIENPEQETNPENKILRDAGKTDLDENSKKLLNLDNSLEKTQAREYSPSLDKWQKALVYWQNFASDKDCTYQKEITIDISDLKPMITWGTNPSEGIEIYQNIPNSKEIDQENQSNFYKSLDYTGLKVGQKMLDLPIEWVFIGSCTNSRLEDLKVAGKILLPDSNFDSKPKIKQVVFDLYGVVFEEYRDAFGKQIRVVKKIEQTMSALKKRFPNMDFYYLSNLAQQTLEYYRINHAVFKYFKSGLTSAEAGVSKPHSEIFQKFLQKFNLNPEETLFIDDLSENVLAAKNLGFQTIHFDLDSKAEFGTKLDLDLKRNPDSDFFENIFLAQVLAKIYNFDLTKLQKIDSKVTCFVVPGSEEVKKNAEEIGLDLVFKLSGADFRMPGCSMCLGMNDDKVPAKKRCLSTSNRNFMHRQGPNSITHLCSPATATASAIKGKIVDCQNYFYKNLVA